MRIESNVHLGAEIPNFPTNVIKNEVMLFSANLEFAEKVAGPITKAFLEALPLGWRNAKDLIIDSRVHMLMPNWYPCIPGMHHDDVPRSRPGDNQPNYYHPEYRSEHVMCLINGDICPTQFALGTSDFQDVPIGEIYYKVWHPIVMNKIKNGELESYSAPSNRLIYFDDRTWHQGTKAVANGWRWFIRASRNTNRLCINEIRRQVQVYMENPMEGW